MTVPKHIDEDNEFTLIERPGNKVRVVDLTDGDTYEVDFGTIRSAAMSMKELQVASDGMDHRVIPAVVLQSYVGEYLRAATIARISSKPARDIWHDNEYKPYLESR
ncbi:hypothetical protein PP304_gp158 [Gordonia phage Phendrix]|uniref:Uncharacterized protein n=1 Tax=Gordonia phage Phendrix TaxID=2593335 RepID=A0A514U182_9CAUD|nr:hypothetical protein PP304_gp158 [Gordonia phage Phendrix]QDK02711.1 hypothetical protein SEA_PHENDRIX_195 [Gordonia phage Phendrix]